MNAMRVFHGTCGRNAAKIAREGLRAGSFVTDDELLAEEYSAVCRCNPARCRVGAVLTLDVRRSYLDRPNEDGFPTLGFVTLRTVVPKRTDLSPS